MIIDPNANELYFELEVPLAELVAGSGPSSKGVIDIVTLLFCEVTKLERWEIEKLRNCQVEEVRNCTIGKLRN